MARLTYANVRIKGNAAIQLEDGDTNTASIKAAAVMAADLTFTLPATVTADGVLSSDGSGTLSIAKILNVNVDAAAAIAESKLALDQSTASLAQRDLDNLTVASLAAGSLLVGSSGTAVSNLAVGTEGYVLKVVSGSPAWAVDTNRAAFNATWVNADTATKSITHSLGTTDVMVEIYDIASGETIVVDTVDRTTINAISVTATEAPDVGGSGWRVLILNAAA